MCNRRRKEKEKEKKEATAVAGPKRLAANSNRYTASPQTGAPGRRRLLYLSRVEMPLKIINYQIDTILL